MNGIDKMQFNGMIVTVELLHKLASDQYIKEINLSDSVNGSLINGCRELSREYDQWELSYQDGARIRVYV